MSQPDGTEKPFAVEKAKTGRSKCKKCKLQIEKDTLRIAKLMSNPFGEGKMKAWHHVDCLFEVFVKQRASTKKIDDPSEDIDGWDDLDDDDKKSILDKIPGSSNTAIPKQQKRTAPAQGGSPSKILKKSPPTQLKPESKVKKTNVQLDVNNRDDTFANFYQLCLDIANVSAYTEKTAIVKKMFTQGPNGHGFQGDKILWCKMLLPLANKRVYNLQSKQLMKLFARILCQDEDDMLEDLEQGDVAETIRKFFDSSYVSKPIPKSLLTLREVDEFLCNLSRLTKENEQVFHLKSITERCTASDLKTIIKLIKHDLRINCGPKHILEAIHSDAYRAYQVSNDLISVLKRFVGNKNDQAQSSNISASTSAQNKVTLSLMTPVLPMLAEACKSVEMAMQKCPNGMLSEIKYDGERVQVHKKGNEFRYFSRSLKPVLPHKVNHLKEYIPKAFPNADDLILDTEILMIDTTTGQPLPFGSLGKHKKEEFKDANVCLFIFDCIYYNGDILLNKTMKERRRILEKSMTPIPNRILISENKEIHKPKDLAEMIGRVLKMGLEGLVLKDMNGFYEPGKRHWLKIKKDYLFDGAMADTADLVVLGAWYGTGNKGGMMSIFLMGCYDETRNKWVTVSKVHGGHDDATLASLQDQLDMIKIGKDPNLLPTWLIANKPMIPDFVARDPKKQPVWEITGAEFTNQGVHTADGISIRFPRVTRIRDDKDWSTSTSLKELKKLYEKSSDSIDLSLLLNPHSDTKQNKVNSIKNYLNNPIHNKVEKTVCVVDERNSGDESAENESNRKKTTKNDKSEETDAAAAYYTYIDNDYIEYDSAGNPLNWIDGRKPKNRLPKDAVLLSKKSRVHPRSKGILGAKCVILSDDITLEQQKILARTLITLGAIIQHEDDFNLSQVTHVVHNTREIAENDLKKYGTVSARHVYKSWIHSTVANSKIGDTQEHAVAVRGSYCNCVCPH